MSIKVHEIVYLTDTYKPHIDIIDNIEKEVKWR